MIFYDTFAPGYLESVLPIYEIEKITLISVTIFYRCARQTFNAMKTKIDRIGM